MSTFNDSDGNSPTGRALRLDGVVSRAMGQSQSAICATAMNEAVRQRQSAIRSAMGQSQSAICATAMNEAVRQRQSAIRRAMGLGEATSRAMGINEAVRQRQSAIRALGQSQSAICATAMNEAVRQRQSAIRALGQSQSAICATAMNEAVRQRQSAIRALGQSQSAICATAMNEAVRQRQSAIRSALGQSQSAICATAMNEAMRQRQSAIRSAMGQSQSAICATAMNEAVRQRQSAIRRAMGLGEATSRAMGINEAVRQRQSAVRRAVGLGEAASHAMGGLAHSDFMTSYERMIQSTRDATDIIKLPTFHALRVLVPLDESDSADVDTHNEFIPDMEQEISAECLAFLNDIGTGFPNLYLGAREALNGDNVDKARHALISLREMLNHLLRELAPDSHVKLWFLETAKGGQLTDKEILTRKNRIEYIYRRFNSKPLTKLVNHDTRAVVELFEILNRVHELEPTFTDDQLRAVFLRIESWLEHIKKIRKAGIFSIGNLDS